METSAFPGLSPTGRMQIRMSSAFSSAADLRDPDHRLSLGEGGADIDAWLHFGPYWAGMLASAPAPSFQFRHDTSLSISLRAQPARAGFAWLLSPESSPWNALVTVPDPLGMGYGFGLRRCASGWETEAFFSLRDREEAAGATAVENSAFQNIAGVWSSCEQSLRLRAAIPIGAGFISGGAEIDGSAPLRPRGEEYWLSDSSLAVKLGGAYQLNIGAVGLHGFADFSESEVFTQGLVIHPVSGGLKRFHYAKLHPLWSDAGLGLSFPRLGACDSSGMQVGTTYAHVQSRPSREALALNRETLSYNRLGLSLFAAVFGGLSSQSELVDLDARLRQAHVRGSARITAGRVRGSVRALMTASEFSLDLHRVTEEQFFGIPRIIGEDQWNFSGWVCSARPEISLAFLHRFGSLEISAAQWLPLLWRLRTRSGSGGGGGTSGGTDEQLWFRNGFSARAGLNVGF